MAKFGTFGRVAYLLVNSATTTFKKFDKTNSGKTKSHLGNKIAQQIDRIRNIKPMVAILGSFW